jgi:hypothetical protein
MEYIIGAVAIGIVLFLRSATKQVDRFNKMSCLNFATWYSTYLNSDLPEKTGIARAFLIQSLELATRKGIISAADSQALERSLRQENPIEVVEGWLATALNDVTAVCGTDSVAAGEARVAGAMMLVCLQSVNPQGTLKRFLQSV